MTSALHLPRERRFAQVDVFTDQPLRGNPLAVVVDADGLDDCRMAAFARWTNLSETTFLQSPSDPAADYRVRIFTPGGELPFAGHPTLGSAWVWLHNGGLPRQPGALVQQCGVGNVLLRCPPDAATAGARLAFAAPPLRCEAVEPALLAAVCAALGLALEEVLAARWLDNGPQWLALRLASAARVRAVQPDHAALAPLAKVGLIGRHDAAAGLEGAAGADVEVRAFAAAIGVPEDPVTGSLNAALAQWLIAEGALPAEYVASQGHALGRAGRVHLCLEQDRVWVGGAVARCIDGIVRL